VGELTPLAAFHPLIRSWFLERVGQPTEAQARAWPRIAAGDHVLVTAPTGSGKTLTAFLWALDQLLTGAWEAGQVRVLYISPLRALNNDIKRNLERPLAELRELFKDAGEPLPAIRTATRSGDTILLNTKKGGGWRMLCSGASISLEPSVYLGEVGNPRRSQQIVLAGEVSGSEAIVKWAFRKEGAEGNRGPATQE